MKFPRLFALAGLCFAFFPVTAASLAVRTTAAAEAFLGTLSAEQKASVLFAYNDHAQRVLWSNLPGPMVKRRGIKLGAMDEAQRKASMGVLAAALSESGYSKILAIVEAEEVLKKSSGNPPGLEFGRDEFFFSFVGKPSTNSPWMLQFGGHHLALNVTISGAEGVLTPSLTAAQPAVYEVEGRTVRPLGKENDLAFQLMGALDADQRKSAILGATFRDIVLGPGRDGKTLAPEGAKVSTFTGVQKELLMKLVAEWVGILDSGAASVKLEEIRSHLSETWFAWSGPTTPGSAAYFRIQGPTVIIEYAPQNLGGVPQNHIHTIYRDPTNEYGRRFGGL
jgi:hypothetical protein